MVHGGIPVVWLRGMLGWPLGLLAALALGALAAGPARAADPERYSSVAIGARVVDAETRAPLEGVFVVVRWELTSTLPFQRGYLPLHILETVTDAAGEFAFPAWGPKPRPTFWRLWGGDPTLIFFKPGYRYAARGSQSERNDSALRTSDRHGQTIPLDPFRGTLEQWARHLRLFQSELSWGHSGPEFPGKVNDYWKHYPRTVLAVLDERRRLPVELRRRVSELYLWDISEEQVRARTHDSKEPTP